MSTGGWEQHELSPCRGRSGRIGTEGTAGFDGVLHTAEVRICERVPKNYLIKPLDQPKLSYAFVIVGSLL